LLLKESGLQYGLKNLKHDLGVKYGKDKYFSDTELFDEIGKLTWPAIKDFLLKYVQGKNAIPYETYFALAGVDYIAKETKNEFSLGASEYGRNQKGEVSLRDESTFNAMGKSLGFRKDDIIYKFNGAEISTANFVPARAAYIGSLKEGDTMKVTVKRKDDSGKEVMVELSAAAQKVPITKEHLLRWMTNPTQQQIALKNKWLNMSCR